MIITCWLLLAEKGFISTSRLPAGSFVVPRRASYRLVLWIGGLKKAVYQLSFGDADATVGRTSELPRANEVLLLRCCQGEVNGQVLLGRGEEMRHQVPSKAESLSTIRWSQLRPGTGKCRRQSTASILATFDFGWWRRSSASRETSCIGKRIIDGIPFGSRLAALLAHLSVEDITSEKGYEKIVSIIEEAHDYLRDAKLEQAFDQAIFKGRRRADQTLSGFVATKKAAFGELKRQGSCRQSSPGAPSSSARELQ